MGKLRTGHLNLAIGTIIGEGKLNLNLLNSVSKLTFFSILLPQKGVYICVIYRFKLEAVVSSSLIEYPI